jgi:carbon starvation protein
VSLPAIAILMLVGLSLAYHFYGRFIAAQYALDDTRPTPAVTVNDGIEFVPTSPFYLLGQHFSAIAAAGPIAGPILACQQFGWLPCLLWIGFGVVFIGAVHDFSNLVASIRHEGRSIAEVIRQHLGRTAWLAMMAFIWLALIYVILAFTDVTADTFAGRPQDLQGLQTSFDQGGAVALASILYLLVAIVMGLVERFVKPPLWATTLIFVPATLACVWIGMQNSTVLVYSASTWAIVILLYCFVSSLLPVWSLLQPRGYLGGFILYIAIGVGVVGIFFGGFPVQQEAFKGWQAPGATGSLFPFLFVTIACGACSGFHGLVCSGTTSKQIQRESHCRSVGYGAMLLEGFVAVIALATVMIATNAEAAKGAGLVYAQGLGRFLTVLIGEQNLLFATTFGAMAFSTFVFDTLDVTTRLGRYILQELTGRHSKLSGAITTAVMVIVPFLWLRSAGTGAWRTFWVLFGTSNQLLAALSLLGISVWLKRSGKRAWYTWAPMVFVMVITLWSLVLQAIAGMKLVAAKGLHFDGASLNAIVSIILIGLALVLMREASRAVRQMSPAA